MIAEVISLLLLSHDDVIRLVHRLMIDRKLSSTLKRSWLSSCTLWKGMFAFPLPLAVRYHFGSGSFTH